STSESLHVADEHREDSRMDLRRPGQDAGAAGLVVAEQQLQAVEQPEGALRVAGYVEAAEQARDALRTEFDGPLRSPPVEAAHALEQEVEQVEADRRRRRPLPVPQEGPVTEPG